MELSVFLCPRPAVYKAPQLNGTVALGRGPDAKREQKNQDCACMRLP